MRVCFLISSPFNEANGIWQKVLLQASAVKDAGAQPVICSFSGPGAMPFEHLHLPLPNGGRKEKEGQLSLLVEEIIERRIDVVYLRRELWHPSFRRLMRRVPTVVEVNTKESEEFKLTMSLPKRIYAWLTRSSWQKFPAGYVSVTKELAMGLPANKPIAVIANGIPRPVERPHLAEKPHLFFSCTGGYSWHGIDKFVRMATMFPGWEFSFAGELPQGWSESNKPRNLKSHGPLSATQADELLRDANIGVGTLALHRKSMNEACPLKLRSYLSYGLPSIIAYEDTDFSGGFRYICELKNVEDNIAPANERIRDFVLANYRSPVAWSEVKFASEAAKGEARLRLFQQVLNSAKR